VEAVVSFRHFAGFLLAPPQLKQVLHVGNAGEVHALAVHPSSDMQLFATGSSDVGRVLDYTRDQYWWPDGPVPKECTTCCVLEDKAACQFDRKFDAGKLLYGNTHDRTGNRKGVYALAFSPSGKQFALGHGEGTIRLLTFPELQSKAVVCQSKLRERISVLEFVEDSGRVFRQGRVQRENRLAAACWDQQIYIFDAPGLKCIRVLKGNSGGVTQLQVSSDRAFVMSNAKALPGSDFTELYLGKGGEAWVKRTGVWAANRSFCAPDVKCCTSLRALTALAAAGEVPKTGAAAAALSNWASEQELNRTNKPPPLLDPHRSRSRGSSSSPHMHYDSDGWGLPICLLTPPPAFEGREWLDETHQEPEAASQTASTLERALRGELLGIWREPDGDVAPDTSTTSSTSTTTTGGEMDELAFVQLPQGMTTLTTTTTLPQFWMEATSVDASASASMGSCWLPTTHVAMFGYDYVDAGFWTSTSATSTTSTSSTLVSAEDLLRDAVGREAVMGSTADLVDVAQRLLARSRTLLRHQQMLAAALEEMLVWMPVPPTAAVLNGPTMEAQVWQAVTRGVSGHGGAVAQNVVEHPAVLLQPGIPDTWEDITRALPNVPPDRILNYRRRFWRDHVRRLCPATVRGQSRLNLTHDEDLYLLQVVDVNVNLGPTRKELLVFGDTSHSVQLYSYPALEGQGHHSFDGHAGFVTTMVPLPRGGDPPEEQLITAGGDDHAIMQWSVGPQTDAPLWLRSTAWREVVAKQDR
ncbi:unnamed protein product, partial [Symbiodinium microadriaticum]